MSSKAIKRFGIAIVLLLLVFAAYDRFAAPYDVMADGRAALVSNDRVSVVTEPYLAFSPADRSPTAGLVFYVGARVPPAAYAPLARDLAAEGYFVAIPEMPFNFAVFGQSAAADVVGDHPDILRWAVGGHSLGGAMAAGYAHRSPRIEGLLLVAAYPDSSVDFSLRTSVAATVVYGTEDERATVAEIEAAADRLPDTTEWVLVEGGNHAQFGWYGTQPGDGTATITRREQHEATVAATLDLLRRID